MLYSSTGAPKQACLLPFRAVEKRVPRSRSRDGRPIRQEGGGPELQSQCGLDVPIYAFASSSLRGNWGDSVHAEPHFGTSCHYQIFFYLVYFQKQD